MSRLSRRRFLTGSAAGLAALGLGRRTGFAKQPLPRPDQSGIKHVIVAMVESADQAAAAVSRASRRTSSQRDTKASTQAGSKWLPALASRWARASASGQAFL